MRESAEKTSSVHFVRFELSPLMVSAVKAGVGVMVGCDHSNYAAQVSLNVQTLASLVLDLH